jgi:serine/threonine protein kinase/tetratricopeptide (TPR) repeat protein
MTEREMFEAALEQPPERRPEFLDGICGGDANLRQRLESLLMKNDLAGSFLESPAAVWTSTVEDTVHERPGTVIGPYKLLEQIGEGGMGLVFMAEQTHPVRRKVALKVFKPGRETRQVVARFEAERQALAMMDHPNIAKIYDAGTVGSRQQPEGSEDKAASLPTADCLLPTAERPYFVMELVRGVPITQYCDERRLSTRQRLELFVTVCQAVQHAHQKGVIHRDLKPSNVLVSHHDTVAVPKIIDFGIAKATTQPLTERTLFTNFAQMMGTPLYMSPEQAEMNGLDLDTRTDVYALGVMLYELLTGTTPFESDTLKKVGVDEMRRIIREDEPPTPSRRLSTMSAQACSTISERRGVDVRKLGQVLRGELDWIVMKALEKDRNRRYESASAFAADVQRYLSGDVVKACPPSSSYRFRKYVSRNRARMVIYACAIAIVFVGLFSLAIGSFFVWQEKEQTKAENFRAQQNLDMAYEILDELYLEQAGIRVERRGEVSEEDRRFLERMLGFYQRIAKGNSKEPAARLKMAMAYRRVSDIHFSLGDYAAAQTASQESSRMLEELANEFPAKDVYWLEVGRSYNLCSHSLLLTGKFREAEQGYRQYLERCEKRLETTPGDPNIRYGVAVGSLNVGMMLALAGRQREAERALHRAIDLAKGLIEDDPGELRYSDNLLIAQAYLLEMLIDDFRLEEAEEVVQLRLENYRGRLDRFQQAGEQGNFDGENHLYQGFLLRVRGKLVAAEVQDRKALARFVEMLAHSRANPDAGYHRVICSLELGRVLQALHAFNEAERCFREALAAAEIMLQRFPANPEHRSAFAQIHLQLAEVLSAAQANAAESSLQQARKALEKVVSQFPERATDRSNLGAALDRLAECHLQRNESHEARQLLELASGHHEAAGRLQPAHPVYRQHRLNHQRLLAATNVAVSSGKQEPPLKGQGANPSIPRKQDSNKE